MDDIQTCSTAVKEALALAKAKADHRDQQLQAIERKQASDGRRKLGGLFARTNDKLGKLGAWQLERDEQRASECFRHEPECLLSTDPGERRQQLLDTLSTHDYLTPFKQSRRMRHGDTTQWLFQTAEFDRWIEGTGPPLLWCSGKSE